MKYLSSINIAHLDIKLENILIDKYNLVKIADFGLSIDLNNQYGIPRKMACGTLIYMAP
jgi:serine/threonine protein kinase